MATTGRVKVKVDATHGPIKVGDLLVTSGTPGVAMKSQPLDLGGVPIHRPGTLIGKALEPLKKGTGLDAPSDGKTHELSLRKKAVLMPIHRWRASPLQL